MSINNAVHGKSLLGTLQLFRLSLVLDRPMNWLLTEHNWSKSEMKSLKVRDGGTILTAVDN
jgi:hypothetical protein